MKNQYNVFLIVILSWLPTAVTFSQYIAYDSVSINNINARINADGELFRNLNNLNNYEPKFEVPKGSGKHSIFTSAIWIGGMAVDSSLHLAAHLYRANGVDFLPGPIMNTAWYSPDSAKWNRIWKITSSEIENHLQNWNIPGYVIPQVFLDWPAHGDTAKGQAYYIAPFFDRAMDGIYNPADGDCPRIKGDEAVYFIFNDAAGVHMESQSDPLGIEVHGMAYAFDCPVDSALNNTLFIDYKIFNRSQNIYDSTMIGIFTDFDIGCASDDYIGTDVTRHSIYAYNGDNIDGSPCDSPPPGDYNNFLPAQSMTLLQGPLADADQLDNSSDCGFITGANDNITDNEKLDFYRTISPIGYFGPTGDPDNGYEFYNYLKGIWKDYKPLSYGGNGHSCFNPWSCIPARYMFPGLSDTLNCGTNGTPQSLWDEITAYNTPGDRRGVASMGPFTFKPGDIQEVEAAYVFGRDYSDSSASAGVKAMQDRIDAVTKMYRNDSTPCGKFSVIGITEKQNEKTTTIFPNPAHDVLTVALPVDMNHIPSIEITDIAGKKIIKLQGHKGENKISLQTFPPGFYFIKFTSNNGVFVKRFIKI